MLEVEIYRTHPLLRAFIMILEEQVHDTKRQSTSTDEPLNGSRSDVETSTYKSSMR